MQSGKRIDFELFIYSNSLAEGKGNKLYIPEVVALGKKPNVH